MSRDRVRSSNYQRKIQRGERARLKRWSREIASRDVSLLNRAARIAPSSRSRNFPAAIFNRVRV
jgi:hypothetical protein